MKKEGVIICFVVFMCLSLVLAQETGVEEKGYSCLKDKVEKKGAGNLGYEELVFSLLALSYDSSLQSKLKEEMKLLFLLESA